MVSYSPNPDAKHPPARSGDERRSAVVRGCGAIWIDAGWGRLSVALGVDGPVVEHVPDCIRGLPRRGQKVRVIAIGENGPGAVHDLVERPRHPDLEALHGAAQCLRVGSLDDAVNVIALHRELHQAEAKAFAPAGKGPAQRAEAAMRAEVPHFPAHAERDVQRAFPETLARTMRNVRARRLALATGTLARAAPLKIRQFLVSYLHERDRKQGVSH